MIGGKSLPNVWLAPFQEKTKNSSMLSKSTNAAMGIGRKEAEAEAETDTEIATQGETEMTAIAVLNTIAGLQGEKELDAGDRDQEPARQTMTEVS